jgi:hypothetical protein
MISIPKRNKITDIKTKRLFELSLAILPFHEPFRLAGFPGFFGDADKDDKSE